MALPLNCLPLIDNWFVDIHDKKVDRLWKSIDNSMADSSKAVHVTDLVESQ